ncbi:MAG: hypothetical protein IPP68_11010 [Elusimicrobia bacterium]|nr:hypothetical protein [Elusimicrobiota bacterium]
MPPARVCLIVDNPLRDLDGLVLLADRLARRGFDAVLVPMYAQGFDVIPLRPALVLANYVRPNNFDLLRLYRNAGVRIGVLDTEGAGGKSAEDHARLATRLPLGGLVDLYCLWGENQRAAMVREGSVPASALRATGCPRFDFCAPPWREALLPVEGPADYILVNTNFPTANPRFSAGSRREARAMRQVGFDAAFADRFIADAGRSLARVIETVDRLAARWPGEHFILRPHPFENIAAYNALLSRPNVRLRQEGTSLQWIRSAKMLIHQNCSTAIEAVMMGREPVSLEWFNTPALMVPGPHRVSRNANSPAELETIVESLLAGRPAPLTADQVSARREFVEGLFGPADGRASQRVAEAVEDVLSRPAENVFRGAGPSLRTRAVHAARRALGVARSEKIRRWFSSPARESARTAKRFEVETVRQTLARLSAAAGERAPAVSSLVGPGLSGQSILVEAVGRA